MPSRSSVASFALARRIRGAAAQLIAISALLAARDVQAQSPADALRVTGQPGDVAFVDVTVVPMDRERLIAHQTVIVHEGRIRAMGPASRTSVPAGATRIDGRGKFLAPGLIDMHAHMAVGTESLRDPAGQQLALYLATGYTTIRSLSSPAAALPGQLAIRDRIAKGETMGPRVVLAGRSLNGRSVSSPADGVRQVEEQKRAGFDVLKTHGGFPSREFYDSIAAAAKRVGLPLVGHVTPEYGLARAMDAGQQVEHLDGFIAAVMKDGAREPSGGQMIVDPATLAQVDEARVKTLAAEMARRGIWNGPTLALFETITNDETPEELARRPEMRYVLPAAAASYAKQKADALAQMPADGRHAFIERRRQLVRALHDAGAKLLAGSDSPQFFMVPGYAGLRELDAFVAAGLSPYAALETATRNPAEFMGRASDVGTVAVGKQADLILLDANPLADIANVRRLSGTMVAGRWLDAARLDVLKEMVAGAVK